MSLYISGGNKIGFEFRKNEKVNDHKNFTVNAVNLADNQWHTITLVTEKAVSYTHLFALGKRQWRKKAMR